MLVVAALGCGKRIWAAYVRKVRCVMLRFVEKCLKEWAWREVPYQLMGARGVGLEGACVDEDC